MSLSKKRDCGSFSVIFSNTGIPGANKHSLQHGKGQDVPEQEAQNFLGKGYPEPWL